MHLLRTLLFVTAAISAHALPAQEWRGAPEYDVLLSSYDIAPKTIYLKAGEPVRLRFVNNSDRSLDFAAGAFFASAKMRERDADMVSGGKIRVRAGQTRTLVLMPRPGRYGAGGGNFIYRLLGMRGSIIVE
ncbi:cupredoxin domain-containing protein [Sphingosinicella rhizophila]|uniref:EfeO-type cupredoxin-like domain-containing protein n=1 Tax=Sphingosinicella rhizophila TaxID=3050082 RepID=A0ABU3Q5L2_9SPHN|nr:hypothetical protein [Sphingosinicella sp. GR2756]MDT9598225.1 hypothetical protein [Sphingosinicella sp. GR2756]